MSSWLTFAGADWTLADAARTLTALSLGRDPRAELADLLGQLLGGRAVLTDLGRTAIRRALAALGLAPGARVVLPALVCPSVIEAVLTAGCRPLFVDVGQDMHLNPALLEDVPERPAAVLVAHLYGGSADVESVEAWCRDHDVPLIDDAAQAFGNLRGGRPLGSFGAVGIISFGPYKNVGCLRGGAAVSADPRLVDAMAGFTPEPEGALAVAKRVLSGWVKLGCRPQYLAARQALAGEGARQGAAQAGQPSGSASATVAADEPARGSLGAPRALSALEAGLALAASRRQGDIMARRRAGFLALGQALAAAGVDTVRLLGGEAPPAKVALRLPPGAQAHGLVSWLQRQGVEAERLYPPPHRHGTYRQLAEGWYPVADELWATTVLVPNPGRRAAVRLAGAVAAYLNEGVRA